MVKPVIVKHSNEESPNKLDIAVGELAIWYVDGEEARLYTKNLEGNLIELGKGIKELAKLEDVDFTNAKEGSFLVKKAGKWVASNFIGSIGNLSDVEIANPQNGEYIRYDSLFESFRNHRPTYSLYDLTDVEVVDPRDDDASLAQDNQVLYYDHTTQTYKTRPRLNLINLLDDVEIDSNAEYRQVLQLDVDGIWKNMDLEIVRDSDPALSNNLNANGFQLRNTSYRINSVVADLPIIEIDYKDGDYWIIEGVTSEINELCIISIAVSNLKMDSAVVMMLEIRQSTGSILIGGLTNIQYEDGKPIKLSGTGKTDLITVTVENTESGIVTYVTANALNLAALNQGGKPSYRYDRNRYPESQVFANPSLYDDYFDYVRLLLNFEPEESTGRLWYEDKSYEYIPIVSTATSKAIDIYTYGIQEAVAEFTGNSQTIQGTVSLAEIIELESDFTLEFFVNYPADSNYLNPIPVNHTYFTNQNNTLSISYKGLFDDIQTTIIEVRLGTRVYEYLNAYKYFRYQNNRYIHLALVRKNTDVSLYIDGVLQTPVEDSDDLPITLISLQNFTMSLLGHMNSVRITEYARYVENFTVPSMRLGLIGGANDILEDIVQDTYYTIGEYELEHEVFC